jgi:hypothetical protein
MIFLVYIIIKNNTKKYLNLELKPKFINIVVINRITFSINTRNLENNIFITNIREIKTIL